MTYLRNLGRSRFHRDQEGATATEYIVLLVFIALAIIVGATILGGGLNGLFGDGCEELVTGTGDGLGDSSAECS